MHEHRRFRENLIDFDDYYSKEEIDSNSVDEN